jgi:hypothetical protein
VVGEKKTGKRDEKIEGVTKGEEEENATSSSIKI